MIIKILLLLIFLFIKSLSASVPAEGDSLVNERRLILSGAAFLAADVSLWSYYNTTWYSGPKEDMHYKSDWYNYSLNIDKLGHMHGTMVLSRFAYYWLRWSNVPEETSYWYSSLTGWLLQLQVELYDAQYDKYGFSIWDVGANTAGAVYPVLQYYLPFLKNVNLKVSYYPSEYYKKGFHKYHIDDYEGRTYWLTFHPYDYLPRELKSIYPEWLGIALGYGGTDLLEPGGTYNQDSKKRGLGNQEWYLSLDLDLVKLFKPAGNTFFYRLLDMLNFIHLPLPALRFMPALKFYIM